MPNILFKNVTLAFTNCMTKESPYGGWNYSFIVDKEEFCNSVRAALEAQKVQMWPASKNTDTFIISKCNARFKENIQHEEVAGMMKDTDILVQVKSKAAPIVNSKKVDLGRGTTADILIDVFEFSYNKRDFICVRSHSDRGCTVRVVNLKEYNGGFKYFDVEDDDAGVNTSALEDIKQFTGNVEELF